MSEVDRRKLRFNGRVAHDSLRGSVTAERFSTGELHRVVTTRATIFRDASRAARERELVLGEGFTVLDRQSDMVFGYAERDGYVGWMQAASLRDRGSAPTHRVHLRHSYAKATADLKTPDDAIWLSMGARVAVTETRGEWCRIEIGGEGDSAQPFWMPAAHLTPVDRVASDPVAVAEQLLGTPYLWGGNSGFGIDCSGLVQMACLACGIACPGDSDQQQDELGRALPDDAAVARGDLLFWTGHVAWVADARTLLHANAHHMAVAFEPMQDAIDRIEAQGEGTVVARRRL